MTRARPHGRTVRFWVKHTDTRRELKLGVKKQSRPAEGPSDGLLALNHFAQASADDTACGDFLS